MKKFEKEDIVAFILIGIGIIALAIFDALLAR